MDGDRQENGITLPHLLRSPVGLPSICRVTIEMVLPLPRQPLCNHLISLLLQNCQFPAPNEPAHNQIASCVKKVELFLCQHTCSPFDSRPLPSLIPALARGYNKNTGESSLFDGKLSYIFREPSQCVRRLTMRASPRPLGSPVELWRSRQVAALTYLFGKQKIVVSAGQLIMFWAIMPHYILEAVPETTMHWLTLPAGRFLQWHLPEAMTQQVLQGQIVRDQKETQREYQLFSQWHHDLQEPWHDYERVMLLEVEAMICFITEHYMEPLQLGQIAQAVGLHPGYATELFRKSFGLSIMGYLLQHRVAHAQRLLATTDQTVLNVAMEAGFTSASRFYATFQKITGQSPRAYRSSLLP